MKKAEIILGAIVMIAIILNLFMVPFGGVLSIVSLFTLGIFYQLNNSAFFGVVIRIDKISAKEDKISRFMISLSNRALFLVLGAIAFKLNSYQGGNTIMAIGLTALTLVLIYTLSFGRVKLGENFSIQLKRIVIWASLGVMFFVITEDEILEFRYRNYPSYVEAVKKAKADPMNEKLWKQVEKEKLKIDKE
jgi:hypothetical protein